MNIQKIPLANIRPYWRNPRNNEKAVAAVEQSIRDYGYNSPIIVDADLVIIAGHTRYKALTRIGYTEIDVCVLSDISPEKAKEYRIADNKTSELAEWDYKNLMPELRELTNLSGLEIFFPELDLSAFVKEDTGSVNFEPVTNAQVVKAEANEQGRFADTAGMANKIELTCPHCLETVFIDRNSLPK